MSILDEQWPIDVPKRCTKFGGENFSFPPLPTPGTMEEVAQWGAEVLKQGNCIARGLQQEELCLSCGTLFKRLQAHLKEP